MPEQPATDPQLSIDLLDPASRRPPLSHPADPAGLHALMAAPPARIGVGRAGPRYTTAALLLFQADHALTQDTLLREVEPSLLAELALFSVATQVCGGKQEYLLRPDLGRKLSENAKEEIRARCPQRPAVQLVVGDGLSAAAVEANLRQILPVSRHGVLSAGLSFGVPFFVSHCRGGVMNDIGELLQPDVLILLIGARPGLGRAERLSAYMAWRPQPGATAARRDVLCNIFAGVTNLLEAVSYVVQLALTMLALQASGVARRLAT